MSKHRQQPATGKPRLKVSDWRYVGLYRYDHKGKRQATRIEPHYTHPGLYKVAPPEAEGRKALLTVQQLLADSLGLRNEEKREAAIHESQRDYIPQGTALPHRQRAIEKAMRENGMTHLLD